MCIPSISEGKEERNKDIVWPKKGFPRPQNISPFEEKKCYFKFISSTEVETYCVRRCKNKYIRSINIATQNNFVGHIRGGNDSNICTSSFHPFLPDEGSPLTPLGHQCQAYKES
ncbi:hypothetical protein NPIL_98891 [Nephila pilipes]|uniref:Uncharacterized protein n=1 Tax=Nephila pilipes TaxID=299642 RepID=A0A8X6IAI3_NEPPI|nr:hypothetical protein NPIL_98891 [Nephila pilipes]